MESGNPWQSACFLPLSTLYGDSAGAGGDFRRHGTLPLPARGRKIAPRSLSLQPWYFSLGGLCFVQETRSGNVADKLLGMVVLGYMALVTVVKKRYIRRYGQWL